MTRFVIVIALFGMLNGMAVAQEASDIVQPATPSVKELQQQNEQLKREVDQLKNTIDQLLVQKQQLQESRQQILSVCGKIFQALLSVENQKENMSVLMDNIKKTLRQVLINN